MHSQLGRIKLKRVIYRPTPREVIPQAGRAQGPAGHGENAAGTKRENSRLSGERNGIRRSQR